MMTARARDDFGQLTDHRFDLRDFDRDIFGQIMDVFPSERFREFRFKLISQRHGIVSIPQNKVLTNLEIEEGLNDQSVLGGAGDFTNVQLSVRSEFS